MATIKQLTTEALQEVEDGKVYDALRTIIAAIEELDDTEQTEGLMYYDEDVTDLISAHDFNTQW